MKDLIVSIIVSILPHIQEIIILPMIAWIGAKLAVFIRAKAKNELLQGGLVRLSESVIAAVKDIEMTIVQELKIANADGKITNEEYAQIKEKAISKVKAYWGSKGIAELAKVIGLNPDSIDSFIGSQIEKVLYDMRGNKDPLALKPSA